MGSADFSRGWNGRHEVHDEWLPQLENAGRLHVTLSTEGSRPPARWGTGVGRHEDNSKVTIEIELERRCRRTVKAALQQPQKR